MKNQYIIFLVSSFIATNSGVFAQAFECIPTIIGNYNNKTVWKSEKGVGFISRALMVDADGAPNSYRVDGKGLSYTCDGLTAIGSTPDTDPDNWEKKCQQGWASAKRTGNYSGLRIFGFQTDASGKPIIQKEGDPLPNQAYISTTSVAVPDGPAGTQRRWVDATQIPYVVLSDKFVKTLGVKPGDIAVVYRPSTNKLAYAVYADGGKLGEASVRLHQDIGNDPMKIDRRGVQRAKRGLEDKTLTLVFPGKTTTPTVDAVKWRAEIQQVGAQALAEWGGLSKLQACSR